MCCCVTADTLIETPHGKTPVIQLEIGSEVLDAHGETVKVLDFIEVDLAMRPLYALNAGEAFFTAEHPFVGPQGEFAMDPQLAEQITLRPIQQLTTGTDVYFGRGEQTLRIEKISAVATDMPQPVYNIIVGGSGTYVANGFAISGKLIPGTRNLPFTRMSTARINS